MILFGTILQAIGTLLLTLPLWLPTIPLLKIQFFFDSSQGMLTDRRGWWPWLARTGLALYMFGYLFILYDWKK